MDMTPEEIKNVAKITIDKLYQYYAVRDFRSYCEPQAKEAIIDAVVAHLENEQKDNSDELTDEVKEMLKRGLK